MGRGRRALAGSVLLGGLLLLAGACATAPAGSGASATSNSAAYAPLGEEESLPPLPLGAPPEAPPVEESAPPPAGEESAVRVVWEALTAEREQFENPRFGRRPVRGTLALQKIVLVNSSHPDAQTLLGGRGALQEGSATIAAVADDDMQLFLRGVEQRGFFRLARPTASVAHLFDSAGARGRVTVERGPRSWTLLSMRGQGLNEATRAIPPLYSELKQTIMVLRNRTPTLNVMTFGR